jgi:signal transduction histidine kinase
MLLRAYLSIEKFLKGLPVIRNIPGFNTLPPNLNPHNLRFYKLCNLVLTLGLFIHASWILLFLYLKVYPLVFINIFSVAIYIFSIIINRNGYHLTSSMIMVMEITAHQLIAVRFFGLEAGFQFYILVITIFPFLMPQGKWVLKGTMLAICVLVFIGMDYWYKNATGLYAIPFGWLIFIRISNITFSFISMTISGAYFNIAMYETEAELARKTKDLVEAEKKITLGNVATEMAHEIQNPLNFVNNFSEINSELIKELREELGKNHTNEEVNELLKSLLENSERINTNGKRVSKIVSTLQDRVNKL